MFKRPEYGLLDEQELLTISRALNSLERIRILNALQGDSLTNNELCERLGIAKSSISLHINILEEAGLVRSERRPGPRGKVKLCSMNCDGIYISLYNDKKNVHDNVFQFSIPVGTFSDCDIQPSCGLAHYEGDITLPNDPSIFYYPERVNAQLLWFAYGYVEYRVPMPLEISTLPKSISISFEACSEAPFYRNDWESDITLWVNHCEIGTWRCPGDFGGRRGKLNPDWWMENVTQYGQLVNWLVGEDGSYLDGRHLSATTIHDIPFNQPYVSIRIGVKPDAVKVGGINIFGRKFGDFAQDIEVKMLFDSAKDPLRE